MKEISSFRNWADSVEPLRRWRRDLALTLRRYGFWGLDAEDGRSETAPLLQIIQAGAEEVQPSAESFCAIFCSQSDAGNLPGVCRQTEAPGRLLFDNKRNWLGQLVPRYRPLQCFVSFSGSALTPIWITEEGRAVLAWWSHRGKRCLLIGLNVVEELVRYTQGNPEQVGRPVDKTLWGYGHERPLYLYNGHVDPRRKMVPWADRLGFTLARLLAENSGIPLLCPLPGGARGAVMLTGDDDEAQLEKYEEQLRLLGDFPITYLLLPHTRHSAETIAAFPPNVELGIHIDALPAPENYELICREQTRAVRELIRRPAHVVRNHGHLNRDYWGHLSAWESCDLALDLNIRGIDGSCPTGSYLPFRVRRLDGSWSKHYSLFSTFSDSMYYMQKWPPRKQIRQITALAKQVERSFPGVLVFNFHPQNITDCRKVTSVVKEIGTQAGWIALGAESYLKWLQTLDSLRLVWEHNRLLLRSPVVVKNLALCLLGPEGLEKQVLPDWSGELELSRSAAPVRRRSA